MSRRMRVVSQYEGEKGAKKLATFLSSLFLRIQSNLNLFSEQMRKKWAHFFCPRSSEEFSEYQSFVRANNRKERVRQRGWLQCSGSTRCS
jgi:hypothetical protein